MQQTLSTDNHCARWVAGGIENQSLDRNEAAQILRGEASLLPLLDAAGRVREHYFQKSVTIHVLDNVRNGACPEDCGYCGQSKDSNAPIAPYRLKPVEEIVRDAKQAQRSGAYRFCMALSGRGPGERELNHMCRAIQRIKAMGMRTCLSAGLLDENGARRLKEAGLDRLNHNLNTSRRCYPDICTTHTYDDRMETLRAVQRAGIGLCSGLIVGMGEEYDDVLDVAYALRELHAESIPVNFLLPIEGNRVNDPICAGRPLEPEFVLRVLCMMRLVNPDAEIRIAAGREHHLRSMQAMALWPANSLFMEGYLLTEGQEAGQTVQMILDAGFVPVFERPEEVPPHLRDQIQSQRRGETKLKSTVRKEPRTFVPSEKIGVPSRS